MIFEDEEVFDSSLDEEAKRKIYLSKLAIPWQQVDHLKKTILEDLNADTYGIDWWVTDSNEDKKLSVLAADYIFQVIESILANAIEGKVHLHQFQFLKGNKKKQFIGAREVLAKKTSSIIPRREKVSDFFLDDLMDAHLIGIFRSIGSSLDCLSACFILVSGLPINVFKADYNRIIIFKLDLERKLHKSQAEEWQLEVTNEFIKIVNSSAPKGWVKWIIEYRNMYIHRGRLRTPKMGTPKPLNILSHNYDHFHSIEQTSFLPKYPDLSEVETYLHISDDDNSFTFGENEDVVTGESINSIDIAIRDVCVYLKSIWVQRRTGEKELKKFPKKQWPKIKKSELSFEGYESIPGIKPSQLALSREGIIRLKAAGLFDHQRDFWSSLDQSSAT